MGTRVLYVEGSDGQIELMTDRVVIHRKGIWNVMKYGPNARREIPLASISSVNFQAANMIRFGSIDFDYAGRGQDDSARNGVKFPNKKQKEFYALKERIFETMTQARK